MQLYRDEAIIEEVSLPAMPSESKRLDYVQPSMVCMAPFCGAFYRAEIISVESPERLVFSGCF